MAMHNPSTNTIMAQSSVKKIIGLEIVYRLFALDALIQSWYLPFFRQEIWLSIENEKVRCQKLHSFCKCDRNTTSAKVNDVKAPIFLFIFDSMT